MRGKTFLKTKNFWIRVSERKAYGRRGIKERGGFIRCFKNVPKLERVHENFPKIEEVYEKA